MLIEKSKAEIKAIPIWEYLGSLGFFPVHQTGHELQYFSPIRQEQTPSFFVNRLKNVFNDFAGEKGDIIRLVSLLRNVGYLEACRHLSAWNGEPSVHEQFEAYGRQTDRQAKYNLPAPENRRLVKVVKLQSPSLIRYAQSRSIPFLLAARYCCEVHYQNKGKQYYALGFKSDKGGYELRNKIGGKDFKSCIGSKATTLIRGTDSSALSLFEGFFDFLSALVYYDVPKPRHDVLVLNSTANLSAAKQILSSYQKIYTFLDHDATGKKAMQQIEKWKFPFLDRASVYTGFTDFSEMISSKREAPTNSTK
ncbi:toprim domain-containing protein [Dyadobacter jiangsuensis]|uniref:CHC2-type zinc finger protein n=1 Tax=Dyadobacter jiangsuensis TaxID=1591085 RepID=A0A2P8FVP9_9BACT|nr:toprim domain-containing protein [Dyadobacter jiangsuensis]PSL25715.1 CHC2-type zinc finger protein [Dyadobacter jiangsuensis]